MGKKRERSTADSRNEAGISVKKRTKREKLLSSAYQRNKLEVVVSLLPNGLSDSRASINSHLQRHLLRYSEGFQGILLAYSNVKISGGGGEIVNELPFIHYTVRMDGLVFCPEKGGRLQGEVTECFQSHISLIVNDFFNASISSDKLRSEGYLYDSGLGEWANQETGDAITKTSSLQFDVEKVHEVGGLISIEGVNPSLGL